jgi:opacity protein-like surface antigen
MRILASLIAVSLASTTQAAWLLDLETGSVSVGKADVRIPNSSLGTPFSMLDDIGGESVQAFGRARITWEINDRHVISALAAPLELDFAGTLDRDIRFAGQTFDSGTRVDGRYRFNSWRLTYRYNFVRRENLTFGLGLTAKIRDAEIALTSANRSAVDDNIGLVPLINFWLDWKMADRWHLLFNGDAAASGSGRAEDIALQVQYDVTDNFGVRAGYRILEGGADSDDVETFTLFHYATVGMQWRF